MWFYCQFLFTFQLCTTRFNNKKTFFGHLSVWWKLNECSELSRWVPAWTCHGGGPLLLLEACGAPAAVGGACVDLPGPPQFSPVLPGHQEGAGDAGLGLGPTRVSELELGAGLLAQWSGWDGRSVVRTEPD